MRRSRVIAAACLLASFGFVATGCGSTSAIGNQGAMVVRYNAPANDVAEAVLAAMDSVALNVSLVSSEKNVIVAEHPTADFDAVVTVEIRDTTDFVEATMLSRYSAYGPGYRHYPYELYRHTLRRFDASRVSVVPERIFPSDSVDCRLPEYDAEGEFTPAALVGGLRALSSQLSYSEAAEKNKIEGQVIVTFIVDERGRVPCARVESGLPFGLNRRALSAILAMDFEAARRNGAPVATRQTLPLTFFLKTP